MHRRSAGRWAQAGRAGGRAQGMQAAVSTGAERSGGRQARGARGAGRRAGHARARQQTRASGLGMAGRAGWLGAVHSVHSAHFRSVLTRYFPESNFLDVVREPGS